MITPLKSPSDPLSTCYEVPVRFVPSHAIARPGFQSHRKGL
jgi:hypothetical protein